jgi:thiol:disulfide interchange protein
MKPLSSSGRTWFAALMLLTVAGLTAHGESFAVGTPPATADRIDFKVDLQPQDPFADSNKVGAPRAFTRGEVIRLVIEGTPRKGFHTYPLTKQYQDQKGNVSTIKYVKNDDVQLLWPVVETPPESINEEGVGLYLEHRKPFTWTQDLTIKPEAKPGAQNLRFTLHMEVCDKNTCQYGDHEFDVPFTIIDAPVVALAPGLEERLKVTKPPVELVTPPPPREDAKTTNPATKMNAPGGVWDLLRFMGYGIFWGATSLITPCVFPMIPITVSYFLKQSEKSSSRGLAGGEMVVRKGRSPLLLAGVYSTTIAVVLTIAGVCLIRLVQPFAQHWATNTILGGLFVFFALSLFGMYDIVLPSGLGRFTASGEGRGGLIGVVFMALTFTVISFACVAPFYGSFITYSASASSAADWLKLVLGALAFSVTFALPFFVLALFPSLLKALPKSGSWLNTVKVVMGFLELAAAFKFLRGAELNFFKGKTEFLTYDLVLGVCIALSVACGLYLLGLYRLPHDHGAHETLSVPRLLFSIAFLGLALYMLPGLFTASNGEQQRPGGTLFAWIDAFLLPQNAGPKFGPGGTSSGQLAWVGDLNDALKQGEAEKKLVFLDFTATTCTNCIYNERNIFIKPEVKNLLRRYVLVHLYTDNVPPGYHSTTTGTQNHELQATFGNDQLPLYVIVRPTDKGGYEVVGQPYAEGKINNVAEFTQFLHDPLAGSGADARAQVMGE